MPSDLVYTPAAGHHWLTPVYDFGVAALTREHRWRSALIKQVRPRAGDVIADIGCGTGSVLVRLGNAAPSARLLGIDPDPAVLACARKKVAAAGLTAELHIGFARQGAELQGGPPHTQAAQSPA